MIIVSNYLEWFTILSLHSLRSGLEVEKVIEFQVDPPYSVSRFQNFKFRQTLVCQESYVL